MATGTAIIDFGATPSAEASVVVTGQAGLTAGSFVEAFMQGSSTADNTAIDHRWAGVAFRMMVDTVVGGVGFTIYVTSIAGLATGTFNINWVYT